MGDVSHHGPAEAAGWPLMLVALAALVALYLAAAGRERARGRRWSGWRTASWVGGAALLAAAFAPPLGPAAHHDLRAHMGQHLLVGMLAPLALVLAAPVTLALRALPVAAARRAVRILRARPLGLLSHPLSALALSAGGMYALYLTPLYAASQGSPALHAAVHAHFLAAGGLFCWAIAGPDPGPHRARWGTRLAVLFVAMAAHATLGKVMYAYGWPRGTPHAAAQIRAAAQLMYYGGDLAELLLAVALFAGRPARRPAGRPRPVQWGERSGAGRRGAERALPRQADAPERADRRAAPQGPAGSPGAWKR